tara:strand:- start:3224 stop:5065 length:1842 start_codon:yes stop_codon:yes gene_type:complete
MQNIKNLNHILLCAFFIFIFKWLFSYFFFKDDISLKIIFDTPGDGYFYYVYTEALSNFKFNESFDSEVKDLKNIPTPFYAVLFPAILLKFFGNYSILFLEFIFIFLFIFIFSQIFKKLNFSKSTCILLSTFLFFIPTLLDILNFDSLPYFISLTDIYSLRFTRPLIVNIFFYLFIFFLFSIDTQKLFTKKNISFLTLILIFSLSSFYYFFVIEILTFIFFVLYKFKLVEIFTYKNFKNFIFLITTFIFLSIPVIFFITSSEPDYMERMYVIDLTIEKKMILINYLVSKLFSIKSFLLILIITIFNIYANKIKLINYDKINILYFLFISSLISPFFFILISSKTGLNYHFTNLIVICAFLYLLIFSLSVLKEKIALRFKFDYLNYICVLLIISVYNFDLYKKFNQKYHDEDYILYRESFKNITNLIRENKNISLLTFDSRLMVWAILNEVEEIKPLSGQLVSKTHLMIENDLIDSFKFLKLNYFDFSKFFENQLSSWRINNQNTKLFFWGRYSASKLQTYKNSKNFSPEEMNMINKTSPLIVQSIAIPVDEMNRLKREFQTASLNEEFKPNLVFLQRDELFGNVSPQNISECKKISNKLIIVYSKLKNNSLCQK